MRTTLNFVVPSILIVSLLIPTFAQDSNLTENGSITDLKFLQKVYLIADSTDARNRILKELQKYPALTVVSSPDKADFFLEYKVLRQKYKWTDVKFPITNSEMIAYISKNKYRRVSWSKTEYNTGISRPNEVNLTRNFIKILKKARGEKN
ncbi:MAG TPA: hypothetical protein VIQ24_07930 [Pyrinomonadaceae bacterium]